MRVLQINALCSSGSTGRICSSISTRLDQEEIENEILFSKEDSNSKHSVRFASNWKLVFNGVVEKLFGNYGFGDRLITHHAISLIKGYDPDIVHLHNIHTHDVNVETLFNYLATSSKAKVVWTLHDCWAFTGYCPYYDYVNCDKWKSNCGQCDVWKSFSVFTDRSTDLFSRKKKAILSIPQDRLVIVTPSEWLKEQVEMSFLHRYKTHVINNGIDLDSFKPTVSSFRNKHSLEGKTILLGVAAGFLGRKGLKYFNELRKTMSDRYAIILVGITKEDAANLTDGIIGIPHTNSIHELSEIYSTADVFVNPTLEDNFPTTNIEALACGTPVVTFKTGGSPEIIDENTGVVVEKGSIDALVAAVKKVEKGDYKVRCRDRAVLLYNQSAFADKYVALYKGL